MLGASRMLRLVAPIANADLASLVPVIALRRGLGPLRGLISETGARLPGASEQQQRLPAEGTVIA